LGWKSVGAAGLMDRERSMSPSVYMSTAKLRDVMKKADSFPRRRKQCTVEQYVHQHLYVPHKNVLERSARSVGVALSRQTMKSALDMQTGRIVPVTREGSMLGRPHFAVFGGEDAHSTVCGLDQNLFSVTE
jgi:hypothetical protein